MANNDFSDLDPGDETRRNGDYVGVVHDEADGTAIGDIAGPTEGQPVNYDGSALTAAATTDTEIAGVLFTYPYYGDSSNAGPYVDGDKNATLKTAGTVVADLSNGGVADGDEGTYWDDGDRIFIVDVFDADNDLAEVLVR